MKAGKIIVSLVMGLILFGVAVVSQAANKPITLTGPDWSLTFPDASWHPQIPPEKDTKLTVINSDSKIRVILVDTRPYLGATKVLTDDIVDYLQNPLVNSQAKDTEVLSRAMVTINGIEYGRIHAFKSSINADVFIWVTVHNKLQYECICGGLKSGTISDTCDAIASTLKLQ